MPPQRSNGITTALLLCTGLVASFALSGLVQAHAIESTLERLAGARNSLELHSRFSSGLPAAGASVSLLSPTGVSLAVGHTDAQGQLRFALPASVDASWELRVDQGPGHRDYLELPAAPQASLSHSHPQSPMAWGGLSVLLVGGLALARRLPRS